MTRPITATMKEPMDVDLIVRPLFFCDLKEGLNIKIRLYTTPRAYQVNILQIQAPIPLSLHIFSPIKVSEHVPS